MTPKEKAQELIKVFNNKENALNIVNDVLSDYNKTSIFYSSKVKVIPRIFWLEVKEEIEKL